MKSAEEHYMLTGIDQLVDFEPYGVEGCGEVINEGPSLIGGVDATVGTECPRKVHLSARSGVLEPGVPILAVEGVDYGLDDLHVLLRHRLLRQP
jgi:hypothetical protein